MEAKSQCRNCGRSLLYGWQEMCRQCDIHTDNFIRRDFRRNLNEFTQRPDIRKKYRLPKSW